MAKSEDERLATAATRKPLDRALLPRAHHFDGARWLRDVAEKHRARRFTDPLVRVVSTWEPAQDQQTLTPFFQALDESVRAEVAFAADDFCDRSITAFASRPVEVRGPAVLDGILGIPLEARSGAEFDEATLALLQWDAARKRFTLVPDSTSLGSRGVVVARIEVPGIYVAIGLPAHPAARDLVRALSATDHIRRRLPDAPDHLFRLNVPDDRIVGNEDFRKALGQLYEYWKLDPDILDALRDKLEAASCDVGEWESLGPNNMPGCVRRLAIDPVFPDRVYAGTEHGGLWASSITPQNTSWLPLTDTLEQIQIRAVAVAPSSSSNVYIGNGLGRIYHSANYGYTWCRIPDSDFGFIRRILVDPRQPKRVLVASNQGFHRWDPNLHIWESLTGSLPNNDVLDAAIDFHDPDILYLGLRLEGLFKSMDGGVTWGRRLDWTTWSNSTAYPKMRDSETIRIALARRNADGSLQATDARRVVVKFARDVLVNDASAEGAFSSWGWPDKGDNAGGHESRSDNFVRKGEWCHVLAVDPFDPDIVIAGQGIPFRTEDRGATWNEVGHWWHGDQQDVVFDSANEGVVYLANDGSISRSDDHGKDFARWLGNDLVAGEFFRVGVKGNKAVGNLDHNGIRGTEALDSKRWSTRWVGPNLYGGDSLEFSFVYPDPHPDRPDRFYAIRHRPADGRPGQLLKLRHPPLNPGDLALKADIIEFADFEPYGTGDTQIGVSRDKTSAPVGTIAVRTDANIILVSANESPVGSGKYRLMATEKAYEEDSVGLEQPTFLSSGSVQNLPPWSPVLKDLTAPIASVVFAPSDPGRAYAMDLEGRVFTRADVRDLTEWGPSVGAWASSDPVRQLIVLPKHPDWLCAISSSRFAISFDSGAGWDERGVDTLPASEFNSLAAHPKKSTHLYLGTDAGVWNSYDRGKTWSPFDDALPNAETLQVFVDGEYLYAVSHGRGLWRRKIC